jgi:uncharacterized membrane protein
MKNITLAASIIAVVIALSAPFALAQTDPAPNTSPPVAAPSEDQMGPGMMTNQYQAQRQGPPQDQAQGQNQGSGYGGMMGGYGFGWMGSYGGMWLLALLVVALVGAGAWVLTQKKK